MAFMKEFEHLKIQLEDIKSATDNFGENKVIGGGGFGKVYIGEVSHSKGRGIVAIKRLDRRHGQGDPEFLKEIMMLSRYTHQNLISLLGFSDEEDEKILVYEHASHGSLDRHLNSTALTWSQRIKICLDAARGLCYLHDENGTQQRVLHRDIKSSNILLDDKWNAKVSDMGLSKIGPANQNYSYVFTNVVGTPGYCDPQYMMTYTLTKESDVYSFGVVLFEVLCGRLCYEKKNGHFKILVPWWKHSYQDKKLAEIIFHGLTQPMNLTSFEAFSDIAFQCLQESREERPPMSLVIEKLETALKFQKPHYLKVPEEYEKIPEAAVDHLVFRSTQELKVLLSKGLFLNEGNTWFSLNDKGQHCLLISIDQCYLSYPGMDRAYYTSRYSLDYNSRFRVGTFNTRDCFQTGYFITRVRSQFLSPGITYMMNLVFKCPDLLKKKHIPKQEYIAITYRLNWGKKINAIVHIEDKREDEWLVARLYQFTTINNLSNNTIEDFQIDFLPHKYWKGGLEIEGIEFQPLEHDDQEQLDEYQEILAVVVPPLIYISIKELKLLLSRGVLLNSGKTWFYINDKGQHCEMISIAECLIYLIPYAKKYYYTYAYNSRFPSGSLCILDFKSRTRVRPQFLSPYITYTVNLVLRFEDINYEKYNAVEQHHIHLKYKLDGETKTWISYLAHKKKDNWWMVELFQFTSNGTTIDLEIIFEGNQGSIVIEGIEFHPFENVEYQLFENKEDMQPISNSDLDDTYWEQKLPNDYTDIMKLSKNGLRWTTKKELYSIFCTGFLINNSVCRRRDMLFSIFTNNSNKWFFLDKNGKKCQMLSAKDAFGDNKTYLDRRSLPDSRFGEGSVVRIDRHGSNQLLLNNIKYQGLSTETTYACYLVFILLEHRSLVEAPVKVSHLGSDDVNNCRYLYLVSPQTLVIVSGKVDANTRNKANIYKINSFPQERSDGWMEIKVCEFVTDTFIGLIPSLVLESESLVGVIIQGIELRSR